MQQIMTITLPSAIAVWWRQYLVWREMMYSSLALQVVNPLLFLFAFGFGLGAIVDTMDGLDYIAFIVPGMMAYSAMFTSSFEASISTYSRFQMQRTWHSILATPVTLIELLMGEAFWAMTKALVSVGGVVLVGIIWGGFDSALGVLFSLLVVLLASFAFAACGLAATVHARNWEFVSYFMTFWVTPNFIFSGVFFAIDRFPPVIQVISWILPTSHVIAVVRPLCAGQPIEPLLALLHILYLALLGAVMFYLAQRKLRARLFD